MVCPLACRLVLGLATDNINNYFVTKRYIGPRTWTGSLDKRTMVGFGTWRMRCYRLDSSGLDPLEGFYEHGNEPSGSVKCWKILE
jgi:hypothetical protein